MKQIIFSTGDYDGDVYDSYYKLARYMLSPREWESYITDRFNEERDNLNKTIDGVIIAFADLGFWNGRRQGYKILGSNIKSIFDLSQDENEWYGDGYNIRGRFAHHDGTHYVLFRVAKDYDEAERIAELIYNNKIDMAGFRKRTRSLYPHVGKIYGWKTGRFTKPKRPVNPKAIIRQRVPKYVNAQPRIFA